MHFILKPIKVIIPSVFLFVMMNSCQSSHNGKEDHHTNSNDQSISTPNLLNQITTITNESRADVGVAVIGPENDTILIHGNKPYRLMSVAKFPQALMLMSLVDEGKFARDMRIPVTERDMKQITGSSIVSDHPVVPFDLSLREVLDYSVGVSDNVTSNIIFNLEGGPKAVEDYVKSKGIADFRLEVDYWNLNESTAYNNASTPLAMAMLMDRFYNGEFLSKESRDLLWDVMIKGPSGANRLKGLLPAGTIVGHKTGTGITDDHASRIGALNDAGIIVFPDGRHATVVVFVSDSYESSDDTAALIAHIGKTVYDHYTLK